MNPKTILITGGSGFIGHHVVEHVLKNTNWNIVLLERLNFSGNLNRIWNIDVFTRESHRVRYVGHDLRFEVNDQVAELIGRPDYILHMAASSHVDRSISDPRSFVLDNVLGTCNVLEFARRRQSGLERFIYFSTDEVFGPAPEGTEYKEYDRYNSGNPYAATKAGGEELAVAYANTYKLPVLITHTMNVFGERQHPEKFIPLVISRIFSDRKIQIHSNKEKTKAGSRFWIHGRNVAAALEFILARTAPLIDKMNIVGEREVDNLDMALTIHRIMRELGVAGVKEELNYELVDFHSSRPGHDLRYALDGTKLRELGFELPKSFEESLRSTIAWTLKHPEWLS